MSNIKFSQLPDQGAPTDATIVPTVAGGVNYTVTGANLKTYVNSTTGNITGNYFIGNGSQLTGIVSTYGNSNVAAYLPVNSANIQGNFISAIGNITGSYLFGNGSQITGLPANYGNTQVASFLAAFGSNAVSTTGNVTAGYVVGNISAATGGYGNANVQAVLQTYSGSLTAATLSTTGNITGNYFVGNGSALTGVVASLSGSMTGNINGNGYQISNVAAVSATGNITGTHYGSGGNLTGIPTSIVAGPGISVSAATGVVTITNNNPTAYTNSNVTTLLSAFGSNTISTTGSVLAGSVSASGNITGTHLGNGAGLSNVVTSIVAGSGISVNSSTGAVTVTFAGGASYVDLTTNQTAAGNKTFSGKTTLYSYVEITGSSGNTSTSFTPDTASGVVQKITATNNFTLNAPVNMSTGQNITLIITQDATGSRVMTANAVYKFGYGVKTLSTAAGSIDMMSIFYDGSNYLCNLVKGYTT